MSDMIDRVARAICLAWREGIWEEMTEAEREDDRFTAQAAIEAMGTQILPLVKQVEGAADLLGSEGFFRASEHLSDVARQIEAALKP